MTNTDSKGRRIIEAKGKRYIVSAITPARPKTEGVTSYHVPQAYVSYWTERNGETFGATRQAAASDKPGTVGRAVWDAVSPPAAESVAKETTPGLNTGCGVTPVQITRNLLVNALVAGGMDHRAALDAVHNAQDAAWEAGYDDGFRAGKRFYKN